MGHDQQHAWLWTSDYRAGEEGSVAVHALTALTTATPPALHALTRPHPQLPTTSSGPSLRLTSCCSTGV